MDITTLKYDPEYCLSALTEDSDGTLYAKKSLKCCIPKRWEESGLSEITEHVRTILVVGIIVDGRYALLGGMTRVNMQPGEVTEETIDNDKYIIMDFAPGEKVIETLNVPVDANIGYYYYLEFTKFARIPWYCNGEQILQIYDQAKYYTGKSFGNSNHAIRVIYALTFRDPKDMDIPFRYSPNLENTQVTPKQIGVNNPGMLLNSTFNRVGSGYLGESFIAGMLNPDEKVTEFEKVYRGLPD